MLHIDSSWEERYCYVDQDFSGGNTKKKVTESVNQPKKHTTTKIGAHNNFEFVFFFWRFPCIFFDGSTTNYPFFRLGGGGRTVEA